MHQEGLPNWIEASSCSCERVFSFVTSHDHGQSTQCMCEVLWIRCNGPCDEEWCLGEMFTELRGKPFRPRRGVRRRTVDIQDNMLLCFEAFKDFSVPCDVEDFEPNEEMMSFWARPSIARTQDLEISEIEELYGKEGDAHSEVKGDLIQPTAAFKAMQQPKKDPPIPLGWFQYDVDAVLAASMQDRTMHEWVSGCCVNSGLFAAGMVCLFGGTR